MTRRPVAVLLVLALLTLVGCSGSDDADGSGDAGSPRSTAPAAPTDPTSAAGDAAMAPATPGPLPPVRACYRLTFDQALAPVTHAEPRPCDRPHTLRTVFSGRVGALVKGKVGPIDSPRVQRAVAAECPRRVAEFLGGPEQALRLSMFRPVWFTPTLAQADRGEDWYRCDVIALAAEGELAPLEGRLEGLLGRLGWKDEYGLCGTAEPGTSRLRARLLRAPPRLAGAHHRPDHGGALPRAGRRRGPRRRAVHRRRPRRGRRPAGLPMGLRVADPRAVAGRQAVRRLLGARGRVTPPEVTFCALMRAQEHHWRGVTDAAAGLRSRACAAAWGRAASPWRSSRAGRGRPACRGAPRSGGARRCRPSAAGLPCGR